MDVAAKPQKVDKAMPQRRAMNRILPVLLASLSAVAVILQGGAFPATAQVPVGTSTPQATGVASVMPSVTMTVTATPVATVTPAVAASPSVTVASTATATASVAPSVSPVRTSTSVVSPGSPVRSRKVETASVSNVAFDTIAPGSGHTCGLTGAGTAYCWGNNVFGQLGDNSAPIPLLPVAVSGGHTFSMIAAGAGHTCGLTSAGAAYCWGYNRKGQLGDNSAPIHLLPVAVSGGHTFSMIAAGYGHTCGLTGAGTAYCWGSNTYGQLGDNSTTNRPVPVAVYGGRTFSTISAGDAHTCGLTGAGTAYCWGNNDAGQLGDGTTTDKGGPTLVSGGRTFSTISAGWFHTCGVASGTFAAWCWGLNDVGQLGDNSTTNQHLPVAVSGGLTFTTISAGRRHTCAIQRNSVDPVSVGRRSVSAASAYCWGSNGNGQLGNATNADSAFPVPVARNLSYTVIGAGGSHTCGITAAATYCWGSNSFGQLGDGTTSDRNTPILDSEVVADAPASSGSSSSAPEATAVPTRTAVPTATPVPLRYTWTRDVDPASITVTSNRGYRRTISRATLDPVTGARTFKEWVRNSVTFDVYGVDENGLLVWADPSDTAIVSQIDWRQLATMDMPAGAVDAIPVATPADGRLLWDVKGTGTIYVVGSDRFLHAIPDLRTFQASYTWSGVIPITPAQLRLMPVGAPIPAVR